MRPQLDRRWIAGVLMGTAAALCLALPAQGAVRVVVRADGSRVLQNEADGRAHTPSPRRSVVEAPAAGIPRTVPASTTSSSAGAAAGRSARTGVRFAAHTSPPATLASPPELNAIVAEHAAACDLDPALVRAVIRTESAGDRLAVSRVGAMGLMQLMPETAAELSVADPWDAADNVRGGSRYLRQLIDRFGRLDLALAAYNAGPTAVERYGAVPPYPETVAYVRRVLSLYQGRPVALAELRVAPGYSPGAAGVSPLLLRGADGRAMLTNTRDTR